MAYDSACGYVGLSTRDEGGRALLVVEESLDTLLGQLVRGTMSVGSEMLQTLFEGGGEMEGHGDTLGCGAR